MKIHEVEQRVGITKRNIRFYEAEGLLSPVRNSQNGYRVYSESDLRELRKIKLLRKLGVPLECIRAVQQDRLPLTAALRRRAGELERERESLRNMQLVCAQLADGGALYPTLDAEACLARIDALEEEGSQFVNIGKKDTKNKLAGAVIAAAVMIALMLYLIGFFLWALAAGFENAPPPALTALLLALPAVVIVGIVLALRQRIRELKGGEEDAASQY